MIGISATLAQVDKLATWLGAAVCHSADRPVPLQEHIIVAGRVYDKYFRFLRSLHPVVTAPATSRKAAAVASSTSYDGDSEMFLGLVLEAYLAGDSVLVFCPSKRRAEVCCELIAKRLHKLRSEGAMEGCKAGRTMANAKQVASHRETSDSMGAVGSNSSGAAASAPSAVHAGRRRVVAMLQSEVVGTSDVLLRSVQEGCAYHHAGLVVEERRIIEDGFR